MIPYNVCAEKNNYLCKGVEYVYIAYSQNNVIVFSLAETFRGGVHIMWYPNEPHCLYTCTPLLSVGGIS